MYFRCNFEIIINIAKESEDLSCSLNCLIAMRNKNFVVTVWKWWDPVFIVIIVTVVTCNTWKKLLGIEVYPLFHSVSNVHFLSKNYKFLESLKNGQFLFLCQSWLFSSGKKIRNISIFAPKLVKNCHFTVLFGQF